MSSLLELIGQFVAVLVAAAFMHFGALLSDSVDSATPTQANDAKSSISQSDSTTDKTEAGDGEKEAAKSKATPKP